MTKFDEIIIRIQNATNDINSGVDKLSQKINCQSETDVDKIRTEVDSLINELEQIVGGNK